MIPHQLDRFTIVSPDVRIATLVQRLFDGKTKPQGSLGRLETLAVQIGSILKTEKPVLKQPTMFVFAADHGVANYGVSAYPQEVTWQMVTNFLGEGGAINVLCNQHGIQLFVVDAGVNHFFERSLKPLIRAKIAYGTEPFHKGEAMSSSQCEMAIKTGAEMVKSIHSTGCNVIAFGEMGIGNTSSASLIMHLVTGMELDMCIGRGSGINDVQLEWKKEVLQHAADRHASCKDPFEILKAVGGFEIAMMAGAMLQAADSSMVFIVDGFVATCAFLLASVHYPHLKKYAVFSHCSDESGHALVLHYLNVQPLVQMGMRLGEGTGAALVYPMLVSATRLLNEMASFDSSGVSKRSP